MSAPPIYIFSVHGSNNNSFSVNANIVTPEKNKPIETQPLVDSGAGGIFMDQNYAWKHRFNLTKLEYPIMAQNVDGTENKQGTIQYYMDLDLQVNGKNKHRMIPYYWIGKPKDYFGITLVARTQPRNKLERRNITMENYNDGRSVR
jgi:hypothetical protein